LAAQEESAVLGYRGLIMEARRAGNWAEVENLVKKLHDLKPKTPWLNLIRFELLARRHDWAEANAALALVSSARLLEPEKLKLNRAAIFAATSQSEAGRNSGDKALAAAEQAIKQAPDWLPAIINLAQQQLAFGHRRASLRTVEKNWLRHPHPQLAAIYRAGENSSLEIFKQTERLCRENEDMPMSRMVLAETALAADIRGETRRQLITLIGHGHATQAAYRMMARLERRESGNEQAAFQWLTKAAEAAPDPVWLCCSCGGAHDEWRAVCKYCGHFNTLEWQSPGVSCQPQDTPALLPQNWID
jgi:HemY protein